MNNNFIYQPEELAKLCRRLKMPGIKEAVDEFTADPDALNRPALEVLLRVLKREDERREENGINRRLKEATLTHKDAVSSNINYDIKRGLIKTQILNMMTCDWIRARMNCLIVGKTGVGKTWLASALGNACCRAGMKAKMVRMPLLMKEMQGAPGLKGGIMEFLRNYRKYDLLILDDWGYGKIEADVRSMLLELFDQRCGKGSVLITSVIPVKQWSAYINDATFADAILDRLFANAIRIEITGDSLRSGQP